jgi:uncharacterized protein YegP (UPF0339 family)
MAHTLRNSEVTMRTPSTLSALFLSAILASFAVGCAAGGDDDFLEEEGETSIPATMDLWSTNGQWYFHVVSGNGNVLLSSEGYSTRLGALNGIISVLDNGAYESSYTAIKGSNGKYHLNLLAANGAIIATTQQYSTKSSATRAIGSCARAVSSYLASWETNTAARAQVLPSDAGWRFNIYAANGAVVLTSESYTDEAAALNGAFSTVENGASATAYEIRSSSSSKWYFVLKASNGQIVGTSQMYATKASAERGRDALVALLPTIELL